MLAVQVVFSAPENAGVPFVLNIEIYWWSLNLVGGIAALLPGV